MIFSINPFTTKNYKQYLFIIFISCIILYTYYSGAFKQLIACLVLTVAIGGMLHFFPHLHENIRGIIRYALVLLVIIIVAAEDLYEFISNDDSAVATTILEDLGVSTKLNNKSSWYEPIMLSFFETDDGKSNITRFIIIITLFYVSYYCPIWPDDSKPSFKYAALLLLLVLYFVGWDTSLECENTCQSRSENDNYTIQTIENYRYSFTLTIFSPIVIFLVLYILYSDVKFIRNGVLDRMNKWNQESIVKMVALLLVALSLGGMVINHVLFKGLSVWGLWQDAGSPSLTEGEGEGSCPPIEPFEGLFGTDPDAMLRGGDWEEWHASWEWLWWVIGWILFFISLVYLIIFSGKADSIPGTPLRGFSTQVNNLSFRVRWFIATLAVLLVLYYFIHKLYYIYKCSIKKEIQEDIKDGE